MHKKYCLEFILTVREAPIEAIRNSLVEFGENLGIDSETSQDVSLKSRDLRIKINTPDPAIIFDICSEFGRLKSVKID